MKKSFLLYIDNLEVLNILDDEQAGKFLKKIRKYNKGEDFNTNNKVVEAIFIQFKNQFDRDQEKYEKICERNKKNGSKGGRPNKKGKTQSVKVDKKETQVVSSGLGTNPENPSGLIGNPKEPKKADNDNEKDNDKETIIISTDVEITANESQSSGFLDGIDDYSAENLSSKKNYSDQTITDVLNMMKAVLDSFGLIYKNETITAKDGKKLSDRSAINVLLKTKKLKEKAELFNIEIVEYLQKIMELGCKDSFYAQQICSGRGLQRNRHKIHNKTLAKSLQSETNLSNQSR